jgi:ribosomal protein RSM22 (predicted rRNA methylase)
MSKECQKNGDRPCLSPLWGDRFCLSHGKIFPPPEDSLGVKTLSKPCQKNVKTLSKECQNSVKKDGEAKQSLSKLLSFFDISLYLLSTLRLGLCVMRGFTLLTPYTTHTGIRFPHTSISTYLFIYIYM